MSRSSGAVPDGGETASQCFLFMRSPGMTSGNVAPSARHRGKRDRGAVGAGWQRTFSSRVRGTAVCGCRLRDTARARLMPSLAWRARLRALTEPRRPRAAQRFLGWVPLDAARPLEFGDRPLRHESMGNYLDRRSTASFINACHNGSRSRKNPRHHRLSRHSPCVRDRDHFGLCRPQPVQECRA